MIKRILAVCLALGLLAGCKVDANRAMDAAGDAYTAATISEADVIAMSKEMRARDDKVNKVAAKNNAYATRLAKITKNLHSVDGLTLNYKVYLTQDVNANASPDGSVRVYSGLMDIMSDDELFFVLGHEIGHVKNGDTMDRFRVAYATSAARKAAGAAGGVAAALSDSQLGELSEAFANAQFSQAQETKADEFGLQLLKTHKKDTKAAETALRKLGGGGGGMFSSHPDSAKRADRMASMR